jgi:hypothetical protein
METVSRPAKPHAAPHDRHTHSSTKYPSHSLHQVNTHQFAEQAAPGRGPVYKLTHSFDQSDILIRFSM